MAIFTEEIALALIEMGFVLEARTKLAWIFADSPLLEETVEALLKGLEQASDIK